MLRHTEPEIGKGICYGRSDIPARPPSDRQLIDLARSLPRAIVRIDTSPLRRCRLLADRLASTIGLAANPDARLAELDFGRWEMRGWDEIPRHQIDAWARDVEGARPHGGESVAQMIRRVRGYIGETARIEGDVLAVTHLGVVRCAGAILGHPDPFEIELGFGRFLLLGQQATA